MLENCQNEVSTQNEVFADSIYPKNSRNIPS